MTKAELSHLIDVASGRKGADLLIQNVTAVDVFTGKLIRGNIAVAGRYIAGIGDYRPAEGATVLNGEGKIAAPGLIDAHIHIESAYVTPEELGRVLTPHGTTTILADPHEIVNVAGVDGFRYMVKAAERTALKIKMELPSCVPATPFENAGAVVNAPEMEAPIAEGSVFALGELMNFVGVAGGDETVLDKILLAKKHGLPIDGHCPMISGETLNAYAAAGIVGNHECTTEDEMRSNLERGLYVLFRQGSACHDLERLLPHLPAEAYRRALFCSDDRQPKTIREKGHLEEHLRLAVAAGIPPIEAIRMATLNPAEAFGLKGTGALAPGYAADIVLFCDLERFEADEVIIDGALVAKGGQYLLPTVRADASAMRGSFRVKDFSAERLKMHLTASRVNAIGILPGGVVTKKETAEVSLDPEGNFVFDPARDLVKVAVIERHHATGNVATALLRGYGIKRGAVALSVAHDSHNIIAVGVSDEEIAFAVSALIEQEGGVVLTEGGRVLSAMPFPVGGIMSDRSAEWVEERLDEIHRVAHDALGISGDVEPVMTLCFMSLPVIPELKLTDCGLFDVTTFSFIANEA